MDCCQLGFAGTSVTMMSGDVQATHLESGGRVEGTGAQHEFLLQGEELALLAAPCTSTRADHPPL